MVYDHDLLLQKCDDLLLQSLQCAVDLYSLIVITCNLANSVTVLIDYYGYIVLCGF